MTGAINLGETPNNTVTLNVTEAPGTVRAIIFDLQKSGQANLAGHLSVISVDPDLNVEVKQSDDGSNWSNCSYNTVDWWIPHLKAVYSLWVLRWRLYTDTS